MGYAEKRGEYWRARYKIETGKYGTVRDANGVLAKFRSRRAAEMAAGDMEAEVRGKTWRDPALGAITFSQYANDWYVRQDLAASTMQNYRRHLEEHLLPFFEARALVDITRADVEAWEKSERAAHYAASSVKTWHGTLHLILGDAVGDGVIDANPATKRRGRGKRAGKSRSRGPEKAVTNPLDLLMIAERAALLAGRDDEFAAVMLMGYTGMRWGEIVGLESEFVRGGQVRVEWQLYELDSGVLHRCPPKDDSHRTIDLPPSIAALAAGHVARSQPRRCACHGLRYVFQGHGIAATALRRPGAKLVDVARRVDVSTGTVSNVLNRPDTVPEATRAKVLTAVEELGYVRGGTAWDRNRAAHWRRSGFATWLFRPAATGWYPKKAPHEAHPVSLVADPWPGVPLRGRNTPGRAEASWLPIAPGLTPHGLRHTHKTLMDELGTSAKLMDERMGHEDGSVQARYSHVTAGMRRELLEGLEQMWRSALDERRAINPRSPVAYLDELLKGAR